MIRMTAVATVGLPLVALTAAASADEITFWHSFTQPARVAAMEANAASFEEATGTKVNIEVVPWPKVTEKWTAAAAAGTLPDVSTCLVDVCIAMSEAGVSRSMTPVVDKMGGAEIFASEGLLEGFNRYGGELISLPFYAHARVLLYRKDLFDAASLEPPRTWDEYVDIAAKLNDPPDHYGMIQMWDPADWGAMQYLYIFMRSNGGAFLGEDGNATFNTPENIEAVRHLVRLYEAGSPEGELSLPFHGQSMDLFTTGKTTMMFETLFVVVATQEAAPDLFNAGAVAVAEPPVAKQTGWFADVVSITALEGDNEDAADAFIKHIYEDDRYIDFLHTVPSGMMPTTKSAGANPRFFDEPLIQKYKDAVELVLVGIAEGKAPGAVYGPNPDSGVIKTGIIERMLHDIVLNDADVEVAVAEAHDEIQEQIDRAKRRRQ